MYLICFFYCYQVQLFDRVQEVKYNKKKPPLILYEGCYQTKDYIIILKF